MKIVRMLNVLYTTFDVLTDPRKNPNIYKVYIYIQKKRSMSSMIDSAVNFSRKRQMTLLERHLCQVKRTEMGVGTCPQMGRQSFFFFFFCLTFANFQIWVIFWAGAPDGKDCGVALLDKKSNMSSLSFMASVMVSEPCRDVDGAIAAIAKGDQVVVWRKKKKKGNADILLNMKIYAVGNEDVKDTTRDKINIDMHSLVVASYTTRWRRSAINTWPSADYRSRVRNKLCASPDWHWT